MTWKSDAIKIANNWLLLALTADAKAYALASASKSEKGEGKSTSYLRHSHILLQRKQIEKKNMEFFLELLVTAALSFIFAFLLSKLIALASTDSSSHVVPAVDLPLQSVSSEKVFASVDEAPKGGEGAAVAVANETERNSDGGDGALGSGEVEMEREEAVELELEEKVKGEEVAEESIEEKETALEDRIDSALSLQSGGNDAVCENAVEREKENLIVDEEEWEGIERSELEKHFDAVVRSVDSGSAEVLARVGSDALMQMYGLHKVATEGPCYEPQPSVLKAGARAKWHAWQRLGNMNPEAAMEQYIHLVSDSVPELVGEKLRGGNEQEAVHSSSEVLSTEKASDLSSGPHMSSKIERETEEIHSDTKKADATNDSKSLDQGHTMTDSG